MTQTLVELVSQHPGWAYALIFVVSFGEALFVIGLFVPSTFVLIAAGTLVGAGKLPFLPILVLATAGAVAGDALSFWIGHRYKQGLRSASLLKRYAAVVERGDAFFALHGGKSVFIGRFVPGVKAIVPGVAGMAGMGALRFSVVNVASAVVWAGAHIVPAAGIGRGLSRLGSFDPRLTALGAAALVVILVVTYLAKLFYGFAYPIFERWRVRRLLARDHREGRLARLGARFLRNDRNIVGWSFVLIVAAFAATGFLTLLAEYLLDPQMRSADRAVYNLLQSYRSVAGTHLMTAVTMAADGLVLTALTVALVGWLLVRRHYAVAIIAGIAIGAQSLFVPLVKSIIQRPRPTMLYSGAESFSFPSGHATQSMTVFGIIAVIVAANLPARWRPAALFAAVAAAALIAFTRLYLGAHWLSDVAAGFCFGLLATAVFAFATRRRDRSIRLAPLAAVLVPVYAAAYGYHLNADYGRWASDYAATTFPVRRFSAETWKTDGWREITRRRITLGGESAEPLRLQTDMSAAALERRLRPLGWSRIPVGTLLDGALPSPRPLSERAAAPALNDGEPPVVAFARDRGPGWRVVLRLWKSNYRVGEGPTAAPILVGGLSVETLEPVMAGYAALDVEGQSLASAQSFHDLVKEVGSPEADAKKGDTLLMRAEGKPVLVLQLRMATAFPMADGCDGLVIASPS